MSWTHLAADPAPWQREMGVGMEGAVSRTSRVCQNARAGAAGPVHFGLPVAPACYGRCELPALDASGYDTGLSIFYRTVRRTRLRAVVYDRYGLPDVLRIETLPKPSPRCPPGARESRERPR
jgi:hypothetical protein